MQPTTVWIKVCRVLGGVDWGQICKLGTRRALHINNNIFVFIIMFDNVIINPLESMNWGVSHGLSVKGTKDEVKRRKGPPVVILYSSSGTDLI